MILLHQIYSIDSDKNSIQTTTSQIIINVYYKIGYCCCFLFLCIYLLSCLPVFFSISFPFYYSEYFVLHVIPQRKKR